MADVYISPTGNDTTGSGTLGAPWLTISKAFTSSASGDTIHCAAGTYTWVTQVFTTTRTVVGAGPSTTIFDGAGAAVYWEGTVDLNISDITFRDAATTFPHNNIGNIGVGAVTVTNCIFEDLASAARGLFGKDGAASNGGTFTMIACLVNDCSTSTGSGYFGSGTGNFSFAIYNCTFYSNISDSVTNQFYNGGEGAGPTVNLDLRNLIVVNANGTGKAWQGGSATKTYTGTVASSNDVFGYTSLPAGMSGAITSDPLFVDPPSGNFNLRPSSPAIDAGVLI